MTNRRVLAVIVSIALFFALPPFAFAQFKVRLGMTDGTSPSQFIPLTAAQEKGYWAGNGIDPQLISFRGATPMFQGMAAGSVDVGIPGTISGILAISRGVKVVMISDLLPNWPNSFFVLKDSPIKEHMDLKGTKIGVVRFGGMNHAYGLQVARTLGIEKDVRFVSAGGGAEAIAALKSGSVDAIVRVLVPTIPLIVAGEVRELISVAKYLPPNWSEVSVFATREITVKHPRETRSTVRAINQATDFVRDNPRWAIEKMKSGLGFSEEGARLALNYLNFVKGGRIERGAVENVRNFLVQYNLVLREKAPPVEEIYSTQFTD